MLWQVCLRNAIFLRAMDGDYKLRFGNRLKKLRQEKNLTLRELALRSEMENQHISMLEHGKYDVQLSTIIKLAAALEVEPYELLKF